jgi:hypothetical protein
MGRFIEINEKETKLIFTETINVKNKIIKVFAKLFLNLEKIQGQYFSDLIKKLKSIKHKAKPTSHTMSAYGRFAPPGWGSRLKSSSYSFLLLVLSWIKQEMT